MKKLLPIFILLFAFWAFGQTGKPSLNSWRGLVLDESTVADAKKVLGEPDKVKENEKFVPLIYAVKWFGNKQEKKFTKLSFKKVENFDGANLYFIENKLKVIELDLKKDLTAAALVDSYDVKFFPLVGNYASGITPSDLAKGEREIMYPERFPLLFNMAAATEKAVGIAQTSAGAWEGGLAIVAAPRGARPGISGGLPGLVRKMQLVSRTLEDHKGTDLLK